MSEPNDHFEELELSPWRVLVIAAHPGDIERGTSAAVAKWTKEGAEVIYLIATRGELSVPGVEPDEAALLRSGEQSAAADAVGVKVVDFLDIDDGAVEATVRLRRSIVSDIRNYGPDIVVVMNHREMEADGTLNDPDHRAVGTAALDAVRAAGNQWAFRDLGEPHMADIVLVAGSPQPTHAIDVTGHEDDAVASFSAHKQHLQTISAHPMADPAWLMAALESDGERSQNATSALLVERIEYAKGRPCHTFIVEEFTDPDGSFRTMDLSSSRDRKKASTRARNATSNEASTKRKARTKTKANKKPEQATTDNTMKLKVELQQHGRSIGIEVPANVVERLGSEARPKVLVEVNGTSFENTVGTTAGMRFIAVNAERRKAAGINVGETFFVAISGQAPAEAWQPEPEPEPVAEHETPKRPRRKRKPARPKS